ncbi:hypothetical protein NW796_28255, partial [Escherichia coli]|uniref:hypothetical protein n=1 Tax=Escherichia coli TaxID=562 RepID=UPI0023B0A316
LPKDQTIHCRDRNDDMSCSSATALIKKEQECFSIYCDDGFIMEGANKRGNSSRLTQSFHFFMFEPIFSPVNALNQPI